MADPRKDHGTKTQVLAKSKIIFYMEQTTKTMKDWTITFALRFYIFFLVQEGPVASSNWERREVD